MVWIPLLKYKWVIGNSDPKIITNKPKHTAHCMQKKNVSYLKGVHGVSAVVLHISSFSTEIEEGDSPSAIDSDSLKPLSVLHSKLKFEW